MAIQARIPLAQQVIVIAGATSALGTAVAKRACIAGARLVLAAPYEGGLRLLVTELGAPSDRVHCVIADPSRDGELDRVREEAIRVFGGVDTWINASDLAVYGDAVGALEQDERLLFDLGFWAIRQGCTAALPALRQRGGVLISVSGEASVHARATYAANTQAVRAYVKSLRLDLKRARVPVAVCLVRTNGQRTADTVAAAVMSCARVPRANVFVTCTSRMIEFISSHLPESDVSPDSPTDEPKLKSKYDLYSAAAQHPWTSIAVASAAALFFGSAPANAPTTGEKSRSVKP